MIIQIGGLLAKRAVWDKKFPGDNDHPNWRAPRKEGGFGQQICKDNDHPNLTVPSQKWNNKFANNHDFPCMTSPLQFFCKVVVIIWMRRPLSKRMMILTIIILMIILKVYLVSWCAAHCNCMLMIRCDWFSLEPMPETPWAEASSFKGLNAIRFVVVLNQLLHNILY